MKTPGVSHQPSMVGRVTRAARLVARASLPVRLPGLLVATGMSVLQGLPALAQSTNGVSLVISGLSAPSGLALGPERTLFVSDWAAGVVYRVGANGTVVLEASGFATPRDVVFDSAGNMYVADSAEGTVYRLDADGRTTILADNLSSPCCLGFDANGNLLVLHPQSAVSGQPSASNLGNYTGAITRISPDGQQAVVASGFLNPQGVLVDHDNNILVAAEGYSRFGILPDQSDDGGQAGRLSYSGAGIFKVDELGQVTRVLDVGSITPSSLALSPQGTLFFSGTGVSPVSGSVFLADSGTFGPFVTGLQQPRGLTTDTNALYVADEAAGKVWRVSLETPVRDTKDADNSKGTDKASAESRVVGQSGRSGRSSTGTATSKGSTNDTGSLSDAANGGIKPLAGCQNSPPDNPDPPTGPWGGEPVNMASGVYQLEHTDLVIPGLMPIVFKYIYRTQNKNQPGRMGIGGSDEYDYRIRGEPGEGTVLFELPSNDRYTFVQQGRWHVHQHGHLLARRSTIVRVRLVGLDLDVAFQGRHAVLLWDQECCLLPQLHH